jgi:hypothetical protein
VKEDYFEFGGVPKKLDNVISSKSAKTAKGLDLK